MPELIEIERPTGSIGLGRRKHPGKLILARAGEQERFEAVKLWQRQGDVWVAEDEGGWEWQSAIQWFAMPKFQETKSDAG